MRDEISSTLRMPSRWASVRKNRNRWESPSGLLEYLLGLHREAERYFGRAVKNFDYVVAKQVTELAFAPLAGRQFNAAVSRPTFGAGGIGFYHDRDW